MRRTICRHIGYVMTVMGMAGIAHAAPASNPTSNPATKAATQAANPGQIISLTVHPAGFSRPALKYRLLPDLIERVPGNAAPVYLLACELMPASSEKETWENVDKWMAVPIGELPVKQVRAAIDSHACIREAGLAARRENCIWDIPWRQEGFMTLLPHLSQLRSLERLLAIQARVEIAEGKFEDAAATLQTSTAMARHLNNEPFLIQVLVGVSIQAVTMNVIDDWVRQPGSPNLYWALTELPQPFADAKGGMAFERSSAYIQLPTMKDAAAGRISAEQWETLLGTIANFTEVQGTGNPNHSYTHVGFALAAATYYPRAKQFLIDDGMPAETVNRLAPFQAVAAYWVRDYDRIIQELTKWYFLPYYQGRAGISKTEAQFAAARSRGEVTPLSTLVPAVSRMYLTVAKLDRRIAALRCVEAIREYASTHNGQAPPSLSAVTEVPVPLDPITGKPFSYQTTETGFILEGETTGAANDLLRYEVRLQK